MHHTEKDEGLKRVIGTGALTANAVNLTVGAGIFALPAVVALHLGASSFIAYILCAILLGLVLLCFINVGTKITTSGGAYAYVEEAFGPLPGFLTNTLYWLGFAIMADAAIANVMADNLTVFFPELANPLPRGIFFVFVFGGLATLNVIGVKESSGFVVSVTLVKLVPLFLLIGVGVFYIDPTNLIITKMPTITTLGETTLILFFAFGGGAESVLSATGEIKSPKRTIPRALLLGVLLVMFIYLSIQFVSQGILGDRLATEQQAPLAAVGEQVFGSFGIVLMVAAAALSCFGCISGDILVTSRLPYAAARDGLLPTYLAILHPKFTTPYRSIILYTAVGFIFSVSGGFRQLAILSSAALLLIYVGVIAATIKLRKLKKEDAFEIPGGLAIPVLALIATGWFLSNLAKNEILGVTIFLAFFTLVYFLMRLRTKTKNKYK